MPKPERLLGLFPEGTKMRSSSLLPRQALDEIGELNNSSRADNMRLLSHSGTNLQNCLDQRKPDTDRYAISRCRHCGQHPTIIS